MSDSRSSRIISTPHDGESSSAGNDHQTLHIAMCVRSFSESGGLELYAHRCVEGLLARGHRVTVVCEVSESTFEHPRLDKLFFPEAPKRAAKAVKISHHFLAASKFVAEHGPFDIIHSQHLPMEGADVVTFHNHTATRLNQVGQRWEQLLNKAKMIYSRAYKLRYAQDEILCRAPVLMFPASVGRDDFAATYRLNERPIPPSYVVAHPGASFPGPSSAVFGSQAGPEAERMTAANSPFTFLFVGKGFRKKGLDILLRACAILKKTGAQFRLEIAGLKAKPFDKLRLQLMGLSNVVEYLGFRHDMQNVYAQAKSIILPSRIEPFGMAPVQGMIYGLVPIVSAVSGVAEVLTDGSDSLILQDHLSPKELAALMRRLIDSPDTLIAMSKKARQKSTQVTWDKTVDATLNGYQMVTTHKKSNQR